MIDIVAKLQQAETERLSAIKAMEIGCTDGGCIIAPPKGQRTNGGCKCSRDSVAMQRFAYVQNTFVKKVEAIMAIGRRVTCHDRGYLGVTLETKLRPDPNPSRASDIVVTMQEANGSYVEVIRTFGGVIDVNISHWQSLQREAAREDSNDGLTSVPILKR